MTQLQKEYMFFLVMRYGYDFEEAESKAPDKTDEEIYDFFERARDGDC